MSIFDRFVSKETGKKKTKLFHPTSNQRRFSAIDAAAAEIKERFPDDSTIVDDFVWVLKEACRSRSKKAMEGYLEPMNAEARFFLSKDRLTAYACLLPPENDGDEITLEKFQGDMYYEGITYGILQEDIPQEFAFGYFHIFPVARGKPPQSGEDGKVTELFQRRPHMSLEVQNGSQVDFRQDVQLQPIRKGAVICVIHPPTAGTDGMDVTGTKVPSPQVVSADVSYGKNIILDQEGRKLTAGVDGILYIENDQFYIHEQKIIEGNLDHFCGTLRIEGNLYIGGNVDGGIEIKASGDIVINGKVGQAQLTSKEGTIHVQEGIFGREGKTFINAAGQVQSPVIEWAEIDAKMSVIAETISNSVIYCGGTVYAMTGRGMIVNSTIRAKDSILCQRIGNLAGGRSQFSVGYPPHTQEAWERLKTELAETQATVDRLWKAVGDLRKKSSHILEGEKALLKKLVEQRDLYEQKLRELRTEYKTVNKDLDKKSKGIIRCEKLYPFLYVQIGKLSEEIITREENCNIHVENNSIQLE